MNSDVLFLTEGWSKVIIQGNKEDSGTVFTKTRRRKDDCQTNTSKSIKDSKRSFTKIEGG